MPSTMTPIATTTLSSAASSITFSSIPATYTHLRVVLTQKMSSTGGNGTGYRFNSDTATNYSFTMLEGTGASAASYRESSGTECSVNSYGQVNQWTMAVIDVFNYGGSTNKTSLVSYAGDNNGAGDVTRTVNLWRSTAAITSIILLDRSGFNFAIGTTATLFGIKAA